MEFSTSLTSANKQIEYIESGKMQVLIISIEYCEIKQKLELELTIQNSNAK